MRTLTPWRRSSLFEGFHDEMDQLMKRFFGGPLVETNGGLADTWRPHCDVEETDNEVVVKADIPGVDPRDLEISVLEDTLVIHGRRKDEVNETKKSYRRTERFVGEFHREIPLPAGADADKITAASSNGVVTITVPKKAAVQPKKVAVKAEK